MSLRNAIVAFRKALSDDDTASLEYRLDGTERVEYGQTEAVIDTLQGIGAALALYYTKNSAPEDLVTAAMYELTDGMTPAQVQEAADGVISMMETLNMGSREPVSASGTVEITKYGAMLTWFGTQIGFPYQGVTQPMESGATQRRKAERTGDEIRLSLVVDGGEERRRVDMDHQQG